ncbi:uncharacterized protein METZ01_LOCUS64618 [marine metagenome]|uniref:Uncharacterized protein n=1 Tax=marine metagenome TaxID=408172 RepID=A0A381T7P5_9ZZZZ
MSRKDIALMLIHRGSKIKTGKPFEFR